MSQDLMYNLARIQIFKKYIIMMASIFTECFDKNKYIYQFASK